MITYELKCAEGHRFEGWFRNREDFDGQIDAKLISCPVCGDDEVEKTLSAVAVHTSKAPFRRRGAEQDKTPETSSHTTVASPRSDDAATATSFLKHLSDFVEKNFDDVGSSFAKEARRMHEGEAEPRSIRGTTTTDEERELEEDGIDFVKLPLPKYDA